VSGFESALIKIWFPKQASLGGSNFFLTIALRAISLFTSPYINAKSRRQSVRDHSGRPKPAVLIVGNLVVGGAGKTPLVIALARAISVQGKKVGLLTSGYGSAAYNAPQVAAIDSSAAEIGDETLLILKKTQLPVAVGKDRALSLKALTNRYPDLDLVISDDGLQHEALPRQIEIVVFDERFAGNERLLPAGPLREPLARLSSVDFIVAPSGQHPAIREQCGAAAPRLFSQTWRTDGFIRLSQYADRQAATVSPTEFKILLSTQMSHRQITLIAGIANPEKFRASLATIGIVGQLHSLGDHARASPEVINSFADQTVIMTEKDAVKYASNAQADELQNCWVALGGVTVSDGFIEALLASLPPHH
jgi:tetraacyldisaccharide 4'-kinase